MHLKFDKKHISTNILAILNQLYYSDFLEILQTHTKVPYKIFRVKFMVPIQAWNKVIANQKSLLCELTVLFWP